MNTKQWMTTLGIGIVATSFASCGGGGGGGGINEEEAYAPADIVRKGGNETTLTMGDQTGEWVFTFYPGNIVQMEHSDLAPGSYTYHRDSATEATLQMHFKDSGDSMKIENVKLRFSNRNSGQIVNGVIITTSPGESPDYDRETLVGPDFTIAYK